jgi:hypothetical protein
MVEASLIMEPIAEAAEGLAAPAVTYRYDVEYGAPKLNRSLFV